MTTTPIVSTSLQKLGRFACLAFFCLHSAHAWQTSTISLNPASADVMAGKQVTITLQNPPEGASPEWGISDSTAGTLKVASDGLSATYTAPATISTQTKLTVSVIVSGTSYTSAINLATDDNEFESRAVVGFQQAAASSSDPKQSFFLDFFILRGLDKVDARDAQIDLWGNVRLASVPQQINASITSFSGALGTAGKALQLNQLVQSAEFVTGLEFSPSFLHHSGASTQRNLGFVVSYGATGPLSPSDTLQVFMLPAATSSQYSNFQKLYGTPPSSASYVAFLNPDRGSFYKQYGVGFRVTSYDLNNKANSPGTYTFTVGQDQVVTGGHYQGLVGKFDVFYPIPLPVDNNTFKFVYLFGTASMRFSGRPLQTDPIVLQAAASTKSAYDPDVMLVNALPSNRDVYRIGIGLDAMSLFRQLAVKKK